MNCSPLGSSVHGILQARILEGFAHALLQEILPTQGSNPCLYIYCIGKRALFHWHHLGSPSVSYQDLKDANEGVGEQTELGMIKLHFKQLCTSRFQPEESSCWYFGGFPLEKESGKWKRSRSVVSDSYQLHGLQPTRFLCPWDFPGSSVGVGCHFLLQG